MNPTTEAAHALLRKAISERSTVRFFAPTPVPDATLAEVLRLTQRAPTGFNTQPYGIVVVRKTEDREKLADAMMTMNSRKVKEAPVVLIFAADLEPSKRVPMLQQLRIAHGATEAEVSGMAKIVDMFSNESNPSASVPTIAWAYKQTTFAAATFLYAAQASGLATCPMEGFDEAKLKQVLDIPDRYSVPVVVACGYANPEMQRADGSATPRLAPTEVFFDGKFGQSSAALFE